MKRLVILILLMGSLIIPVTDVSTQRALPQNIYCIMTVDETISCHETEEACEIVEDQQSLLSLAASIPIVNCNEINTLAASDDDNDNNNDNDDSNTRRK